MPLSKGAKIELVRMTYLGQSALLQFVRSKSRRSSQVGVGGVLSASRDLFGGVGGVGVDRHGRPQECIIICIISLFSRGQTSR